MAPDADDVVSTEQPSPRGQSDRRRIVLAAVGGGLSVVLLGTAGIAVAGMARADSATPSTPAATGSGGDRTAPAAPWRRPGLPGGFGSALGPGIGLGGLLHGQAVVETPDGTYRTIAGQRGSVTAVAASSISVRSDDGYQATYVVNKDAVVIGADKVTDLNKDDHVAVVATVTSGTSTATRIVDLDGVAAKLKQLEKNLGDLPWKRLARGWQNGHPPLGGLFGHGFGASPWDRKASPSPTPSTTS